MNQHDLLFGRAEVQAYKITVETGANGQVVVLVSQRHMVRTIFQTQSSELESRADGGTIEDESG